MKYNKLASQWLTDNCLYSHNSCWYLFLFTLLRDSLLITLPLIVCVYVYVCVITVSMELLYLNIIRKQYSNFLFLSMVQYISHHPHCFMLCFFPYESIQYCSPTAKTNMMVASPLHDVSGWVLIFPLLGKYGIMLDM